jgi:LytS/YehU family sensor histidine kinase
VLILLLLAFFAWPASRHGIWEVLSSLIPHIIVVFLAVVFRRLSDSIRLEKEKQELLLQNTQSELALLKMQVSPHFLFNTLNNIDYLITNDVVKASDCISRLGEILRYMIYDAKAEKIPLSKEIKHIRDYIELIRLRTSGQRYLNFNLTGETGYLQIAPMLFIPLIENAYKHASRKEGEDVILVEIDIEGSNIIFQVNNEYDISSNRKSQENEGIGLNLVRRRLELIYPDKNNFNISMENNRYNVRLTIELDEY